MQNFRSWRPLYRKDSYAWAHLSLPSTTEGRAATCLPATGLKKAGYTATSIVTEVSACLIRCKTSVRKIMDIASDVC